MKNQITLLLITGFCFSIICSNTYLHAQSSNSARINEFQEQQKKLEEYKTQWAVYNKKAINLWGYNYLEADNMEYPHNYRIQIPSFVMPLVDFKFKNGEETTKQFMLASLSSEPKPVYPLENDYYLTSSSSYINDKRYLIVSGSFINQTRYKGDRDAFCALVDMNEKDLTKKIKWLTPISSTNATGEEYNDYGVYFFSSNGFFYLISAKVEYGKFLRNFGQEAQFDLYKLNLNGEILFKTESFLKAKLNNKTKLDFPILQIFPEPNGGYINIISRKLPEGNRYPEPIMTDLILNGGSPNVNGQLPHLDSDFNILFTKIDSLGNRILDEQTFQSDFSSLFVDNLPLENWIADSDRDRFHSYGGTTQDSLGNYYVVLNFNDKIQYRIGESWNYIQRIYRFKNSISPYLARIKAAKNNQSQIQEIVDQWTRKMVKDYGDGYTDKEETFFTKAIVSNDRQAHLKSNFVILKYGFSTDPYEVSDPGVAADPPTWRLEFCQPFLSEEPRMITSISIDNSNKKILLKGKRSGFIGNKEPLSLPLNMELDLNGNVLKDN